MWEIINNRDNASRSYAQNVSGTKRFNFGLGTNDLILGVFSNGTSHVWIVNLNNRITSATAYEPNKSGSDKRDSTKDIGTFSQTTGGILNGTADATTIYILKRLAGSSTGSGREIWAYNFSNVMRNTSKDISLGNVDYTQILTNGQTLSLIHI